MTQFRFMIWRLKTAWRNGKYALYDKHEGIRPIWGAYLLLAFLGVFFYSMYPTLVLGFVVLGLFYLLGRLIIRSIRNLRLSSQHRKTPAVHHTVQISKQPRVPAATKTLPR